VHEEIPDVPQDARRTIRGHIKVWVRVIIEQDGSVFGALADRAGPSRYFERLAIEAAKKWTFSPSDTPARRMMQVRFDFTRSGTTARAVALPDRQDARTVARRRS
jgi:TonB family protein